MNIEIASASEIHLIHKNKEYTLISTYIFEKLITDENLNSHSAKIWQWLFNKARYTQELAITISYSSIAKVFKKSRRTIIRYIDTLKSSGYIHVLNNFNAHGQTSNTFYLRIPKNLVNEAKKQKDRNLSTKINDNISKHNLIKNSITSQYVSNSNEEINEPIRKSKKDNIDVINNTTQPHISNSKEERKETGSSLKKLKDSLTPFHNYLVRNVTPRSDISVTQKNNNLKINTINNNVVNSSKQYYPNQTLKNSEAEIRAFTLTIDENFKSLEHRISDNEQKIQKIYLQIAQCKNSEKLDAFFNEIQKISCFITNDENELQGLKNKMAIQKKRLDEKHNLITKILSDEGERCVSKSNQDQLQIKLEKFGLRKYDIKQKLLEILYAIRFGSLRNRQSSEEELPIDHAINVALKLVREDRWSTPRELNYYNF
jgi:hypothetical protein